jgi:hypothetical protein
VALEYFREIQLFVAKHLDPQAAALAFADEARRQLEDMITARQVPDRYTRYVDGREGVPERAVKPGGTIAYSFTYNADVLVFALAFLFHRSPQRRNPQRARGGPGPGSLRFPKPYRESFWVSIDGKFIPPGQLRPEMIPDGPAELIVGNMQPYNRKVTRQMVGDRALQFETKEHLFYDAAKAVNARFGNVVTADDVDDIDFPGKPKLQRDQTVRGAAHRIKRHRGTFVESPALVIKPRA